VTNYPLEYVGAFSITYAGAARIIGFMPKAAITEGMVEKYIDKANALYEKEKFVYMRGGKECAAHFNDIVYFRGIGALKYIHLADDYHDSFYMKVTDIVKQLPDGQFIKVSKSLVVNLDKVAGFEQLPDGKIRFLPQERFGQNGIVRIGAKAAQNLAKSLRERRADV